MPELSDGGAVKPGSFFIFFCVFCLLPFWCFLLFLFFSCFPSFLVFGVRFSRFVFCFVVELCVLKC